MFRRWFCAWFIAVQFVWYFLLFWVKQVGCPLRCSFCATGKGGFSRNLKRHEKEDLQNLLWVRALCCSLVYLICAQAWLKISFKVYHCFMLIHKQTQYILWFWIPSYFQVLAIEEILNHRVTNVVFMGMGEPIMNLKAVLEAHQCLNKVRLQLYLVLFNSCFVSMFNI